MFDCCDAGEATVSYLISTGGRWNAAAAEDYFVLDGSGVMQASTGPISEAASEDAEDNHNTGSFKAVLERQSRSEPLGVLFDLSDGMTLYVCKTASDPSLPALAYNSTAPECRRLRDGDCIVEVNGVRGTARELVEVMSFGSLRLELEVRRSTCMDVTVRTGGEGLGLTLQFAKQGGVLSISEISDGAIKTGGLDIRPGDRIIRANGIEGTTGELIKMLQASAEPVLTISRCPDVIAAYEQGFRPSDS